MKRMLFVSVMALILVACGQEASQKTFVFEGNPLPVSRVRCSVCAHVLLNRNESSMKSNIVEVLFIFTV